MHSTTIHKRHLFHGRHQLGLLHLERLHLGFALPHFMGHVVHAFAHLLAAIVIGCCCEEQQRAVVHLLGIPPATTQVDLGPGCHRHRQARGQDQPAVRRGPTVLKLHAPTCDGVLIQTRRASFYGLVPRGLGHGSLSFAASSGHSTSKICVVQFQFWQRFCEKDRG